MTDLQRNLVDLGKRAVSPLVYVDPEVYRQEQEKIFARSWQFVGHETQIPNPGDYVRAPMGEESVILWRADDGSIGVFLNSCTHRGMPLCRTDGGNGKMLTCPYHGWSFDLRGRLKGVPAFAETYSDTDKANWGLIRIPRVELYRGLIFACYDADAVSLEDYLGDIRWHLDSIFNRTEGGLRVLPGVHRWDVGANWKFGAEGLCGDNSHAAVAHSSNAGLFKLSGVKHKAEEGSLQATLSNGNGWIYLREHPSRKTHAMLKHNEQVLAEASERLSDTQREQIGHFFTGTVFPNFSLLYAGCTTLRVWQPLAHNRTRVWSWTLADADASPEVIEDERRRMTLFFSPSGVVEQDDGVLWESCQQTLEAGVMRRSFPLNYQQGGIAERRLTDTERPGTVEIAPTEAPLIGFYHRWCSDMGIDQ